MAKRAASTRKIAKSDSGPKELARLCMEARGELYHAGRALHDQVGPLLSVAGLLLDQLRSDFPGAKDQIHEILGHLNQGMDHVRQLSQRVSPAAAVRIGLKRALMGLAELNPGVVLAYEATAIPPGPVVAALYETVSAAVAQAFGSSATHVTILVADDPAAHVTDTQNIHLKISDNGVDRPNNRQKALETARFLAEPIGIRIVVTSKPQYFKGLRTTDKQPGANKKATLALPAQSTIVSIQYASRRSARG